MADQQRYTPLWELTKARLREFYREPGAVFWVFVFPVLLAVGLGIAFRTQPPELPRAAVVSAPDAGWLVEALTHAPGLEVRVLDLASARRALRTAEVELVVRAAPGERAVVYSYDPAREASNLARLAVDDALQRALGRVDLISSVNETRSEPGGRYIDFLLPGLIGLNLMGSSMWGIGYSVVWSRKRRLLKRFAATPMRRTHYLLSYLFSRLSFMVLEVAALVFFGWIIFDVGVRGSIVALGALSVMGAFSFAAISLLVAARTQSIEAASGWMNFVQLPMWMLSGAFFSYARFPEVVHPYIRMLPLTALNDALRAVMNDGVPLWDLWSELLVLGLWTLVPFAIALKVFRWQ